MDEPPAKRARRTDSSVMWDRNETGSRGTASPRSPHPHTLDRDSKTEYSRNSGHSSRKEDDRRRRSRSPRDRHDRNDKRSRSRSPRERVAGARDRDRARVKEEGGRRDRERSRSRDRPRSSRDHKSDRKRDRSRSPFRNGESSASARQRSPPRSRTKPEDRDAKGGRDVKPTTNGADEHMEVDDNDVDNLMKQMMGFTTFKTTQNTKVPGNQIYGVRKEKKTEYRQYMNRVGGFNRPLSPG